MAISSPTLLLTQEQTEVLQTRLGMDLEKLYLIRAEKLHPTAVRIDGYVSTDGHFIVFMGGTASEHNTFLKHLLGDTPSKLKMLYLGLSVYQLPTVDFMVPDNLVVVSAASSPTFNY